MRLVAVSAVKNEADIIEAFVRHTRACVDPRPVFDHDSIDGTREILRARPVEGLPLTLFRDDEPGPLRHAAAQDCSRKLAAIFLGRRLIPVGA